MIFFFFFHTGICGNKTGHKLTCFTRTQPQSKMAAAKVATITIPLLSTKEAAVKFKQNWIIKNQPVMEIPKIEPKEDNLDDSLTSLNWLQNLRIMRIQHPTPPSSPTPLSIQNSIKSALQIHKGGNGIVKISNSHHKHSHSEFKISKVSSHNHLHHNHHHLHQGPIQLDQKIDYKTNSSIKPPYSYSTLIWMAMKESKKHKITLSSIYKWITENFKYYQVADPSWQVNIKDPFFFNFNFCHHILSPFPSFLFSMLHLLTYLFGCSSMLKLAWLD